MPVKTCCVHGCLHTSARSQLLTFFSLPADPRRRALWLPLIGREDLADKEVDGPLNICEVHFDRRDFCMGTRRKLLKQHALPTLYLPTGDTVVNHTIRETTDCSTQTNKKTLSSTDCQTVPSLVWPPLPKRTEPLVNPPPDPLALAGLAEIRREDCENAPDVQRFFKLCDKLLTKELADLVKLQTILKLQNKVN